MKELNHLHHITLCVGDAQEDYDFHTQVLGLRSVKKTLLYDGQVPIYHLYYGNADGDPGSIVTTFPMRHTGLKGRPGTNQIRTLMLAIPEGSSAFWLNRLRQHGFDVREGERFGEKMLSFVHPHGIPYALVETGGNGRRPFEGADVPREAGIYGMHGIDVAVRDADLMADFLTGAWSSDSVADDRGLRRFQMGKGGSGTIIDMVTDSDSPQGSWTFAEGIVHHCAFDIDSLDKQEVYKAFVEGQGYTDFSDRKDRGYFDSIYVRTPGGALFEATVTKPKAWAEDEDPAHIGEDIMVSPQFSHRKEEIIAMLGAIRY